MILRKKATANHDNEKFSALCFLMELSALSPQISLYPFFGRQNLINSFDKLLRIIVKIKTYCLLLCVMGKLLASGLPFYGVQTHFGQFYRSDMDSLSMTAQLDLCQDAGIQMIRDECLWTDVERDSGVYVIPPEVDRYVSAAHERGIAVYMILNYNNPIYAPSAGSGVVTEENRQAYVRYCQAVVEHFAPLGVRHFEIWNEPNHGVLFWTPQPDAGDYTLLLQVAYDSIKAIDSSLIVVGCATSPAIGSQPPFIEGLDFIRDVFAAGGGNYMDALSFHLYQVAYRPEKELSAYLDELKTHIGDKPAYLSEFGYPTHSGWPYITKETQANYVSRMFLSALPDTQLKALIYYDLKNDGTNTAEAEHNFGLLEFDRSPKPAYTALKNLILSTGAERPSESVENNGKYRQLFGDSLQVIWSYEGSEKIEVPLFSKYSRLEDRLGNVLCYEISEKDSLLCDINESPRFLIPQEHAPELNTFSFDHKKYILYRDQKTAFSFHAEDTAGIPVGIDAACLNWEISGPGSMSGTGLFTAADTGKVIVVAEIHGFRDSLYVSVIEDPGIYVVEDFSDTGSFTLISDHLDLGASTLERVNISGSKMLALHYVFTGPAALAYLEKPVIISTAADSVLMDIYADSNIYEIRLNCKDGRGLSSYILMKPQPLSWKNGRGVVKGAVSVSTSATEPLIIEKIQIKVRAAVSESPNSGTIAFSGLRIKRGNVESSVRDPHIPSTVILSQNYPNPFNAATRISYSLNKRSSLRIDIIGLDGKIVNTVFQGVGDAGAHTLDIRPDALPSGIYFYRLSTPELSITRKFCLLK